MCMLSACSVRCCLPSGAHLAAGEGPNKPMVGTPSPAAKCKGPVSPLINNRARLSTARKVGRSGSTGSADTPGSRCFKSSSSACSRGVMPVENTSCCPAAASAAVQLGPMRQRPFLLGLAGGQVAKDCRAGQELLGDFGQGGIRADFEPGTIRCGDSPGRQELEVGERLVSPWLDPMGMRVAKAPARGNRPARAAPGAAVRRKAG